MLATLVESDSQSRPCLSAITCSRQDTQGEVCMHADVQLDEGRERCCAEAAACSRRRACAHAGAGDDGEDTGARALKRPRLVWTPKLHQCFVEAVEQLGLKSAVPKTIMQVNSGLLGSCSMLQGQKWFWPDGQQMSCAHKMCRCLGPSACVSSPAMRVPSSIRHSTMTAGDQPQYGACSFRAADECGGLDTRERGQPPAEVSGAAEKGCTC